MSDISLSETNYLRNLVRPNIATTARDLMGYVVVNIHERPPLHVMRFNNSNSPDTLVAFADEGTMKELIELGEKVGDELAKMDCQRTFLFMEFLDDNQSTAFMAGLFKALLAKADTYCPNSIILFMPHRSEEDYNRVIEDALNFQA